MKTKHSLAPTLLIALLLAVCAPNLAAQGGQSFTTGANSGTSNGNSLIMFEMTALNAVTVYRLGVAHSTVGTVPIDVEIWYRIGGYGTASPTAPPLTNWVFAGVAPMIPSVSNVITEIPVTLNLTIPAAQTVGFAIVRASGSVRYYNWVTGMGPYANSDLSINANGYGGTYSAAGNPRFSPTAGAARAFWGTVWYDSGPSLTVTGNAGTPQSVFSTAQGPGGNGVEAGSFTIASNSQSPNSVMTAIDLKAAGSGNDATAISEVSIYRDDAGGASPGVYDPADHVVGGPSTFPADDGTINFTVPVAEQTFGIPETRLYFVVVKLNGTALPLQTFTFQVTGISVATGNSSGLPSTVMSGLVIDSPSFIFTDTSLPQAEKVFLTFTGICQIFTVAYPNGPTDKPSSINISSLGTADESTDLVNAQLWWDADNDGALTAGDTQVDTQVFASDNGSVAFSLASHPAFQAGQTRRYFVVYELNAGANDLETFKCYISDIGPAPLGGVPSGLPAPSSNGTAGLEVSAAILFGIMNGPAAYVTVNSNAADAVLANATLKALPGGPWTVNTVTFNASGTGTHNNAYAQLALYEDLGGTTGVWDGPGVDPLAAPVAAGFNANVVSFALATTAMTAGTERRFFLVATLNGTAAFGHTFGARLAGVDAVAPPGGSRSGFPTPASTALIIDVAALGVANAPAQPEPATHASGVAGELVAANFRLHALNGPVTVSGINMTTSGTGSWTSDVDGATGVRVFRDDGDGSYSATGDTQLFQGGGAALVTATFTMPLATGEIADLWVVIGLTATAGQGVAATPETFSVAIAAPTDVGASVPAAFGMPAPVGIVVGAIEFNVAGFDPPTALQSGTQPITIAGSGFMSPFSVIIGGTVCPGTPVIAGGTQVTGLTVPPGVGANLPIIVHSGNLPPQTLTQTFTYTAPKDNDPPKSDESGCRSGTGTFPLAALIVVVLLAGFTVALRRREA